MSDKQYRKTNMLDEWHEDLQWHLDEMEKALKEFNMLSYVAASSRVVAIQKCINDYLVAKDD